MDSQEQVPDRSEWLREVVRDHEPSLLRYALSLTGDVEAARDAVQEAFLELVMNASRIDRARPAPWLFTVCRARAIDRARREARMKARPPEEMAALASPAPAPEALAEGREAAAQAVRVLAMLPPKEREVVRLRFQQGLSYKEIASVTGQSVSHVGVLIHEAMGRLRDLLERRP